MSEISIEKLFSTSELEGVKNSFVLGTLAVNESYYPSIGESQEVITYAKNSSGILFFIKSVSPDPIPIEEIKGPIYNDYYIGFDNDDMGFGPEYKHLQPSEQIQYIRKSLEGKLFLFNPKLTYNEKNKRYYKNLKIFSPEGNYQDGVTYIPVPKVDMSVEEFEQALLEGMEIEFKQYNHTMPTPRYVQCRDYIYSNFEEWKKHPRTKTTRTLINPEGVKRIKIDEEEHRDMLAAGLEYLYFFPINYMQQTIDKMFQTEGVLCEEWGKSEKDLVAGKTEALNVEKVVEEKPHAHLLEIEFLKAFEKLALEKGLYYKKEDLINFHTSVKTSALNILAGMSGTGKTKLATLYAEALGLSQKNNTLLVLPISPSYTEPQDLLGHLNVSTGLYSPGETGLIDFLKEAEKSAKKNNGQIHILIMDEINLSQVEHWFAPFISLLELDEKERELRLYSKNAVCHNRSDYPETIHIHDNIIFIGTMNMDETTKDFSDRLLDRANIVVPTKLSFKESKQALQSIGFEKQEFSSEDFKDAYGTFEVFNSWKSKKHPWDAFEEHELEFFDQLHEILHKVDQMKGFSFRNIVRMGDYLNHIPVGTNGDLMINRRDAIDLFIKQRILTKVRGPIEVYEELIGTQSSAQDVPYNSRLYDHFTTEEAQKISDFTESKKELERKARELGMNGYAS